MFPCVSENLILIGWQLVKQIFQSNTTSIYDHKIWKKKCISNWKTCAQVDKKTVCISNLSCVFWRVSTELPVFRTPWIWQKLLGLSRGEMDGDLDLELNLLRDQSIQNVKVRQLRDRISVKQQSWHVLLVFFFDLCRLDILDGDEVHLEVYWNLVNIGLGESIGISNQSTYLQKLPIWPCPSTPPHDHVVGTPLYDSWYESPGKTSLVVGKKKVSSTRPEGRYLRCSLLKKCDFYLGFPPKKMCCHSWNQPIYSNVHVFRCFLVQSLSTVLTIEFFESSIVKRFLTFLLVEMGERWSNCLALDEHKT